jgi:hypothetical protein
MTTFARRFSTARIAHISLRTLYEGSLALPYKDPVRIGPDTPLPRTRRSAVVLFVCPQLDRFASMHWGGGRWVPHCAVVGARQRLWLGPGQRVSEGGTGFLPFSGTGSEKNQWIQVQPA